MCHKETREVGTFLKTKLYDVGCGVAVADCMEKKELRQQ